MYQSFLSALYDSSFFKHVQSISKDSILASAYLMLTLFVERTNTKAGPDMGKT